MKNDSTIGVQLHITSCAIDSYIDQNINGHDEGKLTGFEGLTLRYLYDKHRDTTAKDVMEFTHVAKATASQTLSGLERKGMIVMQTDGSDKRKKIIKITELGEKVVSQFDMMFLKLTTIIENDFTEEEKETFCQSLKKIRKNLGLNY